MARPAPGDLEDLRTLLNSWYIPNDTQQPQDDLADWAASADVWQQHFTVLPRPRPRRLATLATVRSGLREAASTGHSSVLELLLRELTPRLAIVDGGLMSHPGDPDDPSSVAICVMLRAAVDGTLSRVRTCPACGWAFYDSSRNNRRVWCAMTAAEGGRGCGSIAKTRAYRARQAAHSEAQTRQASSH